MTLPRKKKVQLLAALQVMVVDLPNVCRGRVGDIVGFGHPVSGCKALYFPRTLFINHRDMPDEYLQELCAIYKNMQ